MGRPRTGGIYKQDGCYWVRYTHALPNGKRRIVRRRVVENTISHAKKLLNKLLEQYEKSGQPDRTAGRTFVKLATWYEDTYVVAPVYSGTSKVAGLRSWRSVRYRIDLLKTFFGERMLQSITYGHIEGYKKARLSGELVHAKTNLRTRTVSLTSVNRELEVLRRMLNLAVRDHWVEHNPFTDGDGLIQKTEESKRQYVLTFDEEARLLAVCDVRTRRLVLFAIETGLRRGELFLLNWENVDIARRKLTVIKMTTKSAIERVVMLTETAVQVLESIPRSEGVVFYAAQLSYKKFNAVRGKAGLAHIRFHDLRHTFCTRLVEAGLPAEQAARISGHSQMSTFYRYVNVHDDRLTEAGSALDRLRQTKLKSSVTDPV